MKEEEKSEQQSLFDLFNQRNELKQQIQHLEQQLKWLYKKFNDIEEQIKEFETKQRMKQENQSSEMKEKPPQTISNLTMEHKPGPQNQQNQIKKDSSQSILKQQANPSFHTRSASTLSQNSQCAARFMKALGDAQSLLSTFKKKKS